MILEKAFRMVLSFVLFGIFCISVAAAESVAPREPAEAQSDPEGDLPPDAVTILSRICAGNGILRGDAVRELRNAVNPNSATACLLIVGRNEFPASIVLPDGIGKEFSRQEKEFIVWREFIEHFHEILDPVTTEAYLELLKSLKGKGALREKLIYSTVRILHDVRKGSPLDGAELCERLKTILPFESPYVNVFLLGQVSETDGKQCVLGLAAHLESCKEITLALRSELKKFHEKLEKRCD